MVGSLSFLRFKELIEKCKLNNLRHRLVFGTASLHHLPFSYQRISLLHSAFDSGIQKFDTAPSYGNGVNEYELGNALKGHRNNCEINTKFGIPISIYHPVARHFFHLYKLVDKLTRSSNKAYQVRNFNVCEMEKSLNASLKRLNTDYIDTLFIHEPINQGNILNLPELLLSAEKLKQAGKIKFFGVAGDLKNLNINILKSFDILQTQFEDINYLNNYPDKRILSYGSYKSFINGKTNSYYPDFLFNNLQANNNLDIIISTNSIEHLEKTLKIFNENSNSR